jgi:hypothetical protein
MSGSGIVFRRDMRNLLIAATAVLVAGVAVYVLLVDNPLRAGTVSSPGHMNWLPEETSAIEPSYVYRYVPGSDYYALTTIANRGLLPVMINAATAEEAGLPGPNTIEYLVAGRVGADGAVDLAEVAGAPPLVAETVGPGDQLAIWVHWTMGPCDNGRMAYVPGSGTTTERVLVNWSVLGVPRTNWVPLVQNFEIRNIDTDSHDTCAGQSQ